MSLSASCRPTHAVQHCLLGASCYLLVGASSPTSVARLIYIYIYIYCKHVFRLHTLNIRLGPVDLAYVVNHAGDRVIIIDADLLPAFEIIPSEQLDGIGLFVVCGTDEKRGGWSTTLPRTVDYDDFLATGDDFFAWSVASTSFL